MRDGPATTTGVPLQFSLDHRSTLHRTPGIPRPGNTGPLARCGPLRRSVRVRVADPAPHPQGPGATEHRASRGMAKGRTGLSQDQRTTEEVSPDGERTSPLVPTTGLLRVRNAMPEDIRAGLTPFTKTGEDTDVPVVDADGRRSGHRPAILLPSVTARLYRDPRPCRQTSSTRVPSSACAGGTQSAAHRASTAARPLPRWVQENLSRGFPVLDGPGSGEQVAVALPERQSRTREDPEPESVYFPIPPVSRDVVPRARARLTSAPRRSCRHGRRPYRPSPRRGGPPGPTVTASP